MRKYGRVVMALLLCLVLWLCPVVSADAVDVTRPCHLTLKYTQEDLAFSDLTLSLYRVAEFKSDGTFALTAPFDAYPVSIHNISTTDGWKDLAATLSGYVAADAIPTTATAVTDYEGVAKVADLSTGLYLVGGVTATAESGT